MVKRLPVVAIALFLAACGSSTEERSATGGGAGIIAGAAVGGPVGAAVGALAGGAGGAAAPIGADQLARDVAQGGRRTRDRRTVAAGSSGVRYPPAATVREAQEKLKDEGFYSGRVDGIPGAATKAAIAAYQRKNALPVTSALDENTLAALGVGDAASGTSVPAATERDTPAPDAGQSTAGTAVPP